MPKLEPYSKKLDYSYCLGLYPCLTLMETRPDCALRLLISEDADGNEGVTRLREVCARANVREEQAGRVLKRESGKENCFAGLVFKKYSCALESDKPHAVLNRISDSGNLGTICRAAVGFGYKNVAVIKPCVDIFDPHVPRSSMGALFRLNINVFDSFDEYLSQYPDRELYPFMLDGACDLGVAAEKAGKRHSLIFGNEATGLPAEFSRIGQPVKIRQSSEIDSLNLAVAASIAMYSFSYAQGGNL